MTERPPLAIVGMACRLPGGVEDPDAFWNLLANGVAAVTEVPAQRWNAARFHHQNPDAPGRMVTRWGGFVNNADAFDAAFFGISPREAACMDPQHRWLLETGWEALEDAGLPPEALAGSRTGVFVGISHSDYPLLHLRDIPSIDRYTNIGSALSIAANRLSYLLDLKGPSFAVDTACSSSLVALHLAARTLWAGECDYALVGGANAVLMPEGSIGFSQAHMLSPRGRCRAFDAGADGYVRSEGAAMVVVVRLPLAQRMRLPVRALLVATASNQDGHSGGGITVPNQSAQEAMIREALESAGASPRDVVYVEAHGNGTPVGDPIEARAVAAALSDAGEREPLLIGSVKTNIGHLEPASGLAGLIKAVLVLERRQVPPNLHFEQPNGQLPLDRVRIPSALTPLPDRGGQAPLVGVNSFGFGGSNAHALLAEAPPIEPGFSPAADGPCVFPLSARSSDALAQYAAAYAERIAAGISQSVPLPELCAAAALQKSHHPWRHALVVDSAEALRADLHTLPAAAPTAARPKIALVFSGQGPQWWAMGRALYRREAVMRDMWRQCDAACRALGGPALLDALLADEADSRLDHTDIAQPALFTLQAGLTELWRTWGIEPDVVIGHSVGEAAAAWTAGIFDLETIFRIILTRSRWQETTRNRGRMLAASISAEEADAWALKLSGRIGVAARNAPRQVTLAGDAAALEVVATALTEAGVFNRFLDPPYAFHSSQMDPLEHGLRRDLAGVSGRSANRQMISTVTGTALQGPEMDAAYWWRNVRETVRFADATAALLRDGCTAFVEVGPHPVMAAALTEIAIAEKAATLCVASLRRGDDEPRTMLQGLAALYRHGADVRWDALYARPTRPVRLPAYLAASAPLARVSGGGARVAQRSTASAARGSPVSSAADVVRPPRCPPARLAQRPLHRRFGGSAGSRLPGDGRRRGAGTARRADRLSRGHSLSPSAVPAGRTAGADLRAARSRPLVVPDFHCPSRCSR
jgi:acyl transferase domain-containing protein